jgi:FTR1 family protein
MTETPGPWGTRAALAGASGEACRVRALAEGVGRALDWRAMPWNAALSQRPRAGPGRMHRWRQSRAGVVLLRALPMFLVLVRVAGAQDRPAKRVAYIAGVAVEEYAKGVDSAGRLISATEYQEAIAFLRDARESAGRLSGNRADSARAGLDSLSALTARRVPPAALAPFVRLIMESLGAEAALDLPSRPVDLAAGQQTFESRCASCHGMHGQGDGPMARTTSTPPPALGSASAMRDVTPAMMFRIVSVGVAGTAMVSFAPDLTPDQRWDVVEYAVSLRAPAPRAEGQGLYVQRCAECHGAAGGSNGTLSAALSRLPIELSSFAWQAERSDGQIAEVVRRGIAGTAMPPSRDLGEAEISRIVAYIRTLALNDVQASPAAAQSSEPAMTARKVLAILDEALEAARAGRRGEASDRAFDAYIAFEPLETPARARNPGLVGSLESHFANFRGAINGNDPRQAEASRNIIQERLPDIVALNEPTAGRWGAFLQSLLIILREGFEAILVIGAIVAFLLKTGHRERLKSIWAGVLGGLGASLLTAVVLATVLSAIPASREIIEGITMLVAVAVLFSVSYWLISKVEAARWQQFIRDKVTAALERGGGKTLAFVAFLAVYREGAETALFYQALFQDAGGHGLAIALGLLAGAAGLVVVFTLFYRYGVRIPLRPFFAVTSALLYYLAFVFVGKGIHELQEANIVSWTVLPGWPQAEKMGIFATVETLLAQVVLVALFVFALLRTFWPRRSVALPMAPADAGAPRGTERTSVLGPRVEQLGQRMASLERRLEELEHAIEAAERVGTVPSSDRRT